ncbi:MAG: chloride channel protein [Pseudomonadota bacterium]
MNDRQLNRRPSMRIAVGTALLAVPVGIAAALAALAFLVLIGWVGQVAFGTTADPGQLSTIDPVRLMLITTLGGLLVGLVITWVLGRGRRPRGPADVIAEARGLQSRLTFRDGLGSAAASVLSIGVGASVGRYGPAVHLGATLGAFIGRALTLSNVRHRMLIAAGAAAAIAASFNAPLGGVLFAHEVILGSFGLRAVTPVVIGSVVGVASTRWFSGDVSLFALPNQQIAHIYEYPLFALVGILGGYGAIAFMRVLSRAQSLGATLSGPLWVRTAVGGGLLGMIALSFPQILGLGEGTIGAAINGEFALQMLIALAVVKMIATSISLGAGLWGGILGPALFIGAMLGAAVGTGLSDQFPNELSDTAVYALAGMGAVISRVIGGPITTIVLVFELTQSYSVTSAVMVAVVVASLIPSRRFAGSYFEYQLGEQGVDLAVGGEVARLRQHPLSAVLSTEFLAISADTSVGEARARVSQYRETDIYLVDDRGRLVGALSAGQLLDAPGAMTVSELPHDVAVVLHADMTVDEAMVALSDFVGVSVPVVETREGSRLIGILHENALFTAYRDAVEEEGRARALD